ncbi:predicted protein [Chaetomium globosum CBS 148.51]|uniref:Uncharacterized protein n=1 Tax=Chaetomium globosum (strain ATCC 6205 / CBS 148.51 / DSM 1962 / NBRC 6347 / NRRL 1970) TaxID=306901 RepID=Q2GRB4_CHAGB|nr:uncharacterized protein CHGG_09490 [Chaetomium globosum CBS 148.51]EAQ85476.1 predicted protein [Chaetomium globosum CBS 148.51]
MASSSAFNNYIVDSAMGPTCSRQVPPGSFGVPARSGHGHFCACDRCPHLQVFRSIVVSM